MGGSVWALIDTAAAPAFVERWLRAYRSGHPHLTSEGFVSPPSDGIRPRLTLDTCDRTTGPPDHRTTDSG